MRENKSELRDIVEEDYTPIVLWVKSDTRLSSIIDYAEKDLNRLPSVNVAVKDKPYRIATEGVYTKEDLDGDKDNE